MKIRRSVFPAALYKFVSWKCWQYFTRCLVTFDLFVYLWGALIRYHSELEDVSVVPFSKIWDFTAFFMNEMRIRIANKALNSDIIETNEPFDFGKGIFVLIVR